MVIHLLWIFTLKDFKFIMKHLPFLFFSLERFMNDFKPKLSKEDAEELYHRLAMDGKK